MTDGAWRVGAQGGKGKKKQGDGGAPCSYRCKTLLLRGQACLVALQFTAAPDKVKQHIITSWAIFFCFSLRTTQRYKQEGTREKVPDWRIRCHWKASSPEAADLLAPALVQGESLHCVRTARYFLTKSPQEPQTHPLQTPSKLCHPRYPS